MGTGYTRNDSSNNIADGNVINASDLDGEFDAIVTAFSTSGHSHDGTSAEGGPITKVGPAQQLEISATGLSPSTTNTLDLGSTAKQFKDIHIDGEANLDRVSADAIHVAGAVSVDSTLSVVGAASVGGSLGVSGNASVVGTLSIGGEFTFATANVSGTLGVVGAASVGGTFNAIGNTSVGGTFTVTNNMHGSADLDIKGAVSVGGVTTFTNEINVAGGISGASTLDIKGAASVNETLRVIGETNLMDAVSVQGILTTNNKIVGKEDIHTTETMSAGSTLFVHAATTLNNNLTVAGKISGSSTLHVQEAASVGTTLGVGGNASVLGTLVASAMDVTSTLEVVGAASVGGTLGITGNASITGTLTIADEFTFATANSTGNLGVVKNASVGGTFHIEGNTSAQGTLNVKGAVSVASTLGVEGEINNEVGNIIIDPTTKIVEIKGGGSTDGQIQLNCRSNSHGQKIMSQPHSEAITNEMLLPKGANSTLVSEAGTATITNKTLDVIPSISVTGTLKVGTTIESLSTVSDVDGNLRAVPQSRYLTTAGKHTATTTDVGNFIHLFSSDQTLLIGSAGVSNFVAGDIFTVVSHGQSANSTTTYSAAQVLAFVAGAETSTALITIANNGVSSVLFTSAGGCIITGNVS